MADGPRPVEVLHDGAWFPGTLDRWKHDERGWMAHVWWSEGAGLTHVEWLPADRLRPVIEQGSQDASVE